MCLFILRLRDFTLVLVQFDVPLLFGLSPHWHKPRVYLYPDFGSTWATYKRSSTHITFYKSFEFYMYGSIIFVNHPKSKPVDDLAPLGVMESAGSWWSGFYLWLSKVSANERTSFIGLDLAEPQLENGHRFRSHICTKDQFKRWNMSLKHSGHYYYESNLRPLSSWWLYHWESWCMSRTFQEIAHIWKLYGPLQAQCLGTHILGPMSLMILHSKFKLERNFILIYSIYWSSDLNFFCKSLLSCHAQNFVVINWLEFGWEKTEISIKSEL